MSRLRCVDLSVSLGQTEALRGVDVSVAVGEWVALIGPNGAGKSTLLRALGGLLSASAGEVQLDGEPLSRIGRRAVAQRIAFVAQDPITPEEMPVRAYVTLGRTPHRGYLGRDGAGDAEAVRRVLDRLDLTAMADRPLGTLSGGERQRAVLARALAQEASTLLLDEPTSALDVGRQQHVLDLVQDLRVELGLTVVAAMHDLTLAGHYADRLVMLDGGRVVASGAPDEILTEDLIGAHYGARVRVLTDGGVIAVVPWVTPGVPTSSGR
jgi:iron complex transport system ATP-binding protein